MKTKFLLLLLAVLICSTMSAQDEHLKFMGIPLNITVDAFQKQLEAKGMSRAPTLDIMKDLPIRQFKGNFTGMPCVITLGYNVKNKIVYKVTVLYASEIEDMNQKFFEDTKNRLILKYSQQNMKEDTDNGFPCSYFFVYDASGTKLIGDIELIKMSVISNGTQVGIIYEDLANSLQNEKGSIDDL